MDWNKTVKMTVPVGLCGWQQQGSLTINGLTKEFPVGVETELPEPVAERIKALIADAEEKAEHVQLLKPWQQFVTGEDGVAHWSDRIDKPGSPHQYLTTDGNGKPHWENKLAYEDVQVLPVLNDATVDIKWAQAFPTYGLEWPNDVAVGDKGVMYINGVAYDYTAAQGPYGSDSIEFVPDDASASCPEITKAKMSGKTVLMVYSTVTGITITISITKVVKTLKTIDPKYLPSGSGGGGVMWITAQAVPSGSDSDVIDQIQNPSHTYADVKTAVDAGRFCVLKLEFPDGTIFYMPISATIQAGMDAATIAFIGLIPGMKQKVMVNEAGWISYNQ